MGASSATFALELADTCKPTVSALDAKATPVEDFIKQMVRGMLGKELILMRVGSGSAKRWVVRAMSVACDCEYVALARVARH